MGKRARIISYPLAVAGCTTLRRAILTFCERFRRDAPLMDLGLQIGDEHAWFWRSRPKSVIGWIGDEEGQQFALGAMIRVVRAAAGPDWVPSEIQLESAKAPWLFGIPELGESRVHLGCPVVGIDGFATRSARSSRSRRSWATPTPLI